MNELFAVIDWENRHGASTLARELAADGQVGLQATSAVVLEQGPLAIAGVLRRDECLKSALFDQSSVLMGYAVGDPTAPGHPAGGMWNLARWDEHEQVLTITSDMVGMRPLYWWHGNGLTIVASTLRAFRLVPGFTPRINPRVLAATLSLAHPECTESMLEGVEMMPACSVGRFGRSGPAFESNEALPTPAQRTVSSAGDLVDEFEALLVDAIRLEPFGGDAPVLGLSGGLDSRLSLALAHPLLPDMVTGTWGTPSDEDFRIGAEISRIMQVPHNDCVLHDDDELTRESLAQSALEAEAFGAVNIPFYAGPWVRLLRALVRPLFHTFMIETLGGSQLVHWPFPLDADPAGVTDAIMTKRSWQVHARIGRWLLPGRSTTLTEWMHQSVGEAWSNLPGDTAGPRLILLNVLHRQRRYLVNAAPRVLGLRVPVHCPFYSRPLFELCLSLPPEWVAGRRLARELLARRFPELARFPLAGGTPAFQRLPYVGPLLRRFRDTMWGRPRNAFDDMVERNRGVLVEEIRTAAPALGDLVDVPAIVAEIERGGNVPRAIVMRLFNVAAFTNAYVTGDQPTPRVKVPAGAAR